MKTISDEQIVGIQRKLKQMRETARHAHGYLEIIAKGFPLPEQEQIKRHLKCLSDANINADQIGVELERLKQVSSN